MSTISFKNEFEIIDLILKSKFDTRGIDAFSLAIIKTERQIRKIFTFIIYQYPAFDHKDRINLIDVLAKNRKVFFEGFIQGINKSYSKTVEQVYGINYQADFVKVENAIAVRNKIFHGQLTGKNLTRVDLINMTNGLKCWSGTLAEKFLDEIGYDGFMRNSFRKNKLLTPANFSSIINNMQDYKTFIKSNLERQNVPLIS